jgi:hypothetical protein
MIYLNTLSVPPLFFSVMYVLTYTFTFSPDDFAEGGVSPKKKKKDKEKERRGFDEKSPPNSPDRRKDASTLL